MDYSVSLAFIAMNKYGRATGGYGESEAKTIKFRSWYRNNWQYVIRSIGTNTAEKIVSSMRTLSKNESVFYSYLNPKEILEVGKKYKWDFERIDTSCGANFFTVILACLISSGIKILPNTTFDNLEKTVRRTFGLKIFKDKKYLISGNELKPGDILVAADHMAVVMSKSSDFKNVNSSYINNGIGSVITLKPTIIRNGPDDKYKIIKKTRKKEMFEVLSTTSEEWYKIVYPQVQTGYAYIQAKDCNYFDKPTSINKDMPLEPSYTFYMAKIINKAKVFKYPDEDSEIIGYTNPKEKVFIGKEFQDWAYLKRSKGWILKDNIEKEALE